MAGSSGKLGQLAPALTDAAMKASGRFLQSSAEPPRGDMRDNLYGPARDGAVRSSMPPLVPGIGPRRTSLLLAAQKHPVATLAFGTLLFAAIAVAARER